MRKLLVFPVLAAFVLPPVVHAQTGATGKDVGTVNTKNRSTIPTGAVPRLPNGHVDFSGVWDHPYVPDMSATNARNPSLQTGAGPLPYEASGR